MSMHKTNHSDQVKPVIVTSDALASRSTKFKSSFRRRRPMLLGLIAVVIIAGGAWYVAGNNKSEEPTVEQKGPTQIADTAEIIPYDQQLSNELSAAQQGTKASSSKSAKQQSLAYQELGRAYLNSDQPAKSVEAFEKALELDPSQKRDVLSGIIYAYSANKQFEKAIAACEELLVMYKNDAKTDDSPTAQANISGTENNLKTLKAGEQL